MPIYFEDRRLVRRLLAGDERAFSQFFDDNFARLYRFTLTRLPDDPDGARDVVQAALTRGLRRIHTYRGEAALFSWLCAICRNELSDWLRRRASFRSNIVLIEDYPAIREVVESLDAPDGGDPGLQYQKLEVSRLIQVALDRLPARYGNALEWKYIEGHSVKEIARRLEISHEAAQSLLARAKRAFRDIYITLTEPVLTPPDAQKT